MVLDFMLGRDFTLSYLLRAIFLGQASTPLYYVLVLFVFTLITPLLVKCIRSRVLSTIVFLSSFFALTVFYLLEFFGYDVWFYSRYTIVWLSFYYFGILMRNCDIDVGRYKNKSVVFAIVALCLEMIETSVIYSYTNDTSVAFSQIRLFAFVYAFTIAIVMFSNHNSAETRSNNIIKRILVYLGDNSYGIYFIHMFYITIFTILLEKFIFEGKVLTLPAFVYSFVELIIAIILSLLSIKILKLIFKKSGAWLFGV